MTWFGFLNCNKPSGMTSRDVVNLVQRRLRKVKVGHAGTLDPLANGVLVLGLGPAAKLVTHVQAYPKRYIGEFRLGEHSPSEDIETESTRPEGLPIPDRQSLDEASRSMIGRIRQTPSAYSAIHVDGRRAYDRARNGEQFEMPSREVQVDEIIVRHYSHPNLVLEITCGSGTYIRSIGSDLAKKLGTFAVMTALKRTSIGPFHEEDAIDTATLKDGNLIEHLLPPSLAVQHLPHVVLSAGEIQKAYFGQSIDFQWNHEHPAVACTKSTRLVENQASSIPSVLAPELAAMTEAGELAALLRLKSDRWHPHRVFPPAKRIAEEMTRING